MTEFTQSQDQDLDTVLEAFGVAARPAVMKVKELVDEYVAIPFNTRKAKSEEIQASFELLHRIYLTALSAPENASIAAINYLVRRFAAERQSVFNPIRVNMMPNVEQGGSKTALRFVADMNQLFGSLAVCGNAEQLRRKMRLEPVLASIRSESQRKAVRQYVASIDH